MKHKTIQLTLVGQDGNAFALIGAFRLQASKEGWAEKDIKEVLDEAMSGDYNHLVATLNAHCDSKELDFESDTN